MAMLVVRIMRSLPLVILLIVIALIVYFYFIHRHSPKRAKEVLIKLFTGIGIALTAFFTLACIYAWSEHNNTAFDFAAGFLVVALITLLIARICHFNFMRHNPHYKKKPTKTTTKKNRLK